MWKVAAPGSVAGFVVFDRQIFRVIDFIGLAGISDDLESWWEGFAVISDTVFGAALAFTAVAIWQSAWGVRRRNSVANSMTTALSLALAGKGASVARHIVRLKSLERVEILYEGFMEQPHRRYEERVLAAYWFKTSKLKGLTLGEAWRETTKAAHDQQSSTYGSNYQQRVISEAEKIRTQVYGDQALTTYEDGWEEAGRERMGNNV